MFWIVFYDGNNRSMWPWCILWPHIWFAYNVLSRSALVMKYILWSLKYFLQQSFQYTFAWLFHPFTDQVTYSNGVLRERLSELDALQSKLNSSLAAVNTVHNTGMVASDRTVSWSACLNRYNVGPESLSLSLNLGGLSGWLQTSGIRGLSSH